MLKISIKKSTLTWWNLGSFPFFKIFLINWPVLVFVGKPYVCKPELPLSSGVSGSKAPNSFMNETKEGFGCLVLKMKLILSPKISWIGSNNPEPITGNFIMYLIWWKRLWLMNIYVVTVFYKHRTGVTVFYKHRTGALK